MAGATGLMTAGAADPAFLDPTITGIQDFGSKSRLSIVLHRSWSASHSSHRSGINLSALAIISSMSNKTRGIESTSIPSRSSTACPPSTADKASSMACVVPVEYSTNDSKGTYEYSIPQDTHSTLSTGKNLDFGFHLVTGSGDAPTSILASALPPLFSLTTLSLLFPFPFSPLPALGSTPEGSGAWNDPTMPSTTPTTSSACLLFPRHMALLVLPPPKSMSASGTTASFNA
ncbi:hypothetical protein C7212DRAFT_343700 [Tuber magnatum]|uniref:Uncharacterized protein n=1 Tax=Tuber magnatum TaxID=42249 RepID=A0A317SRJ3_9PEZI|nr:hypothetical protein C7212DRAFT_343700 [Tuber magnatum]